MTRRGRLVALTAVLAVLASLLGGAVLQRAAGEGADGSTIDYSREALDREGRLLRAFQTDDDRWRLPLALADVDPTYLAILKAYEDARFDAHPGVDPFALLRAGLQWAWNGRIISGGSTLSMQAARLLDGREDGRSLAVKAREIARALSLERRLGKARTLEIYLALAPFGGNVEGLRAASLAYFGKEPRRLTHAEAALLVAVPQSPEARRPDRFPERARAARDRVLERVLARGALTAEQVAAARSEPVPVARRPMPAFAWHASEEAIAAASTDRRRRLTLDRPLQERLETLAKERARALGARLSVAILVVDHRSGEIRARIGAADPLDVDRQGAVDMTRAWRSPGSALKPFIYALAYEAGLAHPETLIDDRPTRFGGYAPANFDRLYQGAISTRQALQASLNVPAVALLEAVGPRHLVARFEAVGARTALPRGEVPGLAIGLGGVGVTLHDLARLYASLAREGDGLALRLDLDRPAPAAPRPLVEQAAARAVTATLAETPAPDGAVTGRVAYKTGTSYGHRDALAIGFDGAHTIAVWVGRPDGASTPGVTGRNAAAPLLFDAFQRLGASAPLKRDTLDERRLANADLPLPLRRFGPLDPNRGEARDLSIASPRDGVRVDLGLARGEAQPLRVRASGGRAPYTLLLDGRPVGALDRRRAGFVEPDGAGFTTLSVIDADGRSASVTVRVE